MSLLPVLIPIVLVTIFLILLTGFYVAAEFSAVSAKKSRLAQMVDEGSRSAQIMLAILEDPNQLDAYVAACQLGITVASLVLGFYGQAQLAWLIAPIFERLGQSTDVAETAATSAILILMTVLTVLFGELIPKNLGVRFPEKLSLMTLGFMRWSMRLFRPLIWVFNGSGQLILRLLGFSAVAEHAHIHSHAEIRTLVEESGAGGVLDQEERRLLVNTLQLRNITARRVMIPRNRMFAADVEKDSKELLTLLAKSAYSRLPLYKGTIDNIVGVVHLKDLLYLVHGAMIATESTNSDVSREDSPEENASDRPHTLREIMRTVGYVPESMPAEKVLESMQRRHDYLIIVADEYGGTVGMITIEDLFEEIIGEFEDEFDIERLVVRMLPGNRLVVRGDAEIVKLNEQLDLNLPTGSVETLGGLVFNTLGRLAEEGETVLIKTTQARATHPESAHIEEVLPPDGIDKIEGDPEPSTGGLAVRVERMDEHRITEISFVVSEEKVKEFSERLGVDVQDEPEGGDV